MEPLFPNVTVKLVGKSGNAFFIIGTVRSALRKAGRADAADEFMAEAMSGDYDNVLRTCMKYVTVE
jgi:hypothetical protein